MIPAADFLGSFSQTGKDFFLPLSSASLPRLVFCLKLIDT